MNAITETKASHTSIAAALAAAVGEVRILGKSERNKFDGYNFVSIDKFLELVNPICAKHGLFPLVSQDEIELYENVNSKGGKATWARFYFSISLHHSTGESIGPVKSMVAVPMNGAQASGSAQSYALKQFFRATLMIPTGDKDDADLNPTEQHRAPEPAPRHQPKPAQRDPAEIADSIIKAINKCGTIDAIKELFGPDTKASEAWDWLAIDAPEHSQRVNTAKAEREAALREAPF